MKFSEGSIDSDNCDAVAEGWEFVMLIDKGVGVFRWAEGGGFR
jgi:hypothetical protein